MGGRVHDGRGRGDADGRLPPPLLTGPFRAAAGEGARIASATKNPFKDDDRSCKASSGVAGQATADGGIMSNQSKYMMGEDRIPHAWYNIVADLPSPPPPPLHPGTGQPIGPDDLAPLFPMALIGQEVSQERDIEIPDARPRDLPPVAADAAPSRARAGEGARDAGADLLQVRGRQPGRQPQAQHRRRRRPSTTSRKGSRSFRPRPAPGSGAPRSPSPARCSASKSRSTWSRCPTTRSPTGER